MSNHDWHGFQVVKARDDYRPVLLARNEQMVDSEPTFSLQPDSTASWVEEDEFLKPSDLRTHLEPWLTSLFQSDHLGLLVGSGLTAAVHGIATGEQPRGMEKSEFTTLGEAIDVAASRNAEASGRGEGNIEDQIRVVVELIRGLSILAESEEGSRETANSLESELESVIANFANSILSTEESLATAPAEKREAAFNYLVSFLMSFASRTGSRDRLQLFTTNYDRVIEAGAELAGVRLLDRFVGVVSPILRASRLDVDMHYNPPGIRGEPRYVEGVARFTKLHGSVDWIDMKGTVRRIGLPFGASSLAAFLEHMPSPMPTTRQLMVYPNPGKDRETASFPYVDLFRDFAGAVCRPNTTLVTYGYGFGDEHINRVIEDMLTIPSSHLVVISYSDPLGRISAFYDRVGRHQQMTLLVGDHVGELEALVDYYLPKSAIDRTTIRMADILKARWRTASETSDAAIPEASDSS